MNSPPARTQPDRTRPESSAIPVRLRSNGPLLTRPDLTRHPTTGSGQAAAAEFVWFGVPGEVFVVEGVVAQAAVEDADEPVREGAEGLVVGGAAGALPVVEGAGAG